MDRVTVYSGQVPRTLDILMSQQNAMVGIAKNAETVLGTSTLVDGFTCTPTGPASLNVILTPGTIYQQENLEASTWSALSTDTHTIVKQGIQLDPVTFGITPPGTVGYSQVFLVEVQYADSDTGSTVLPYYNASNPAAPYSGPGNAGTAQNTVRKGIVASQVKAGTAATTGTQTTPTADAGWTGLFAVTVANGATTITSGNIATLSTAPFLQANGKLPKVPFGVQGNDWVYAQDTGTANNLVVTLSPAPAAYKEGMKIVTKIAHDVTGATVINVNGLGNKSIVHNDASALIRGDLVQNSLAELIYDGTNFQIAWQSRGAPTLAGVTGSQSYPTHGAYSFTVPAGTHWLLCKAWAAGGGGGGGSNSSSAASGAGGGEYREGWISVIPGESVAIVVGQGGAGGNSSGGNGTDGGNSSVTATAGSISCVGGSHSPGAVGVVNSSTGAGGTGGSGGSFVVGGTPGGYPVSIGANTINGMGGGSFGCGWGLYGFSTNGLFPGQGGSGASQTASVGGNGADGLISLQW